MNYRIITAIICAAAVLSAMAYERVELRLENSEIYPETTHDIIVTIPDGYISGNPAAVYIGLDGILCNAPSVIDSLSAAGAMPPAIGIFIHPGVVRDSTGTVLRYNRSNEFDSTDGRFAHFLESEIFPSVDSLKLPGNRFLKLTDNPDERMIFGLSSGGIAAFTSAWNRPDLFRRVFCGCGTFVPMRGGHELQVLVRKTEPKPIRIFLEDGYSDAWNPLFGSWFEANTLLASALRFAGYDCDVDWHEGGHSVSGAARIFKDVMKWMWRDYPQPITKGTTSNDMLAPLLDEASEWENAEELPLKGSPKAIYPDSALIAEPIPGSNWLSQTLLDSQGHRHASQQFYWLHSPENRLLKIGGMAFDGNGNLWVVTDAGLQICDQNGRVRAILIMPHDIDVTRCGIVIDDKNVRIDRYSRRLNVTPPKSGTKPASQGQA